MRRLDQECSIPIRVSVEMDTIHEGCQKCAILQTTSISEAILHVHTVHEGTGPRPLREKLSFLFIVMRLCMNWNMTICTCLFMKVQVPFVSQARIGPLKCSCSSWCPAVPPTRFTPLWFWFPASEHHNTGIIWCEEMLFNMFWSGNRHLFEDPAASFTGLAKPQQGRSDCSAWCS